MTFIQLTDPHLSDNLETTTWHALRWAINQVNDLRPDLLIITGDVTTYGNRSAAQSLCSLLSDVAVPIFFSPGNAEHRNLGALPELAPLNSKPFVTYQNQLFLFPDTSRGSLSPRERNRLQEITSQNSNCESRIVATHYPTDALDADSRAWFELWLVKNKIELLVAGHKHIHRTRKMGQCTEIITRGLDPDKAIGDLPGISMFENPEPGQWHETFIPWKFDVELQPSTPASTPVGWSIQGDPIAATEETRDFGLSCLELRPPNLEFSRKGLDRALTQLRSEQDLYLSWHLPNISWDSDTIQGIENVSAHLNCARDMGVNHLTVHVPQAPAQAMKNESLWQRFEDVYDQIFREAVESGIRLAIENVHNAVGVQPNDPICKFATDIDAYLQWINAMATRFDHAPNVGAHFDVGHARNNGEYGNIQPISEWYARIGTRILGYHIHQIGTHPETGKIANHVEMHTLFDRRVSYAGFCYAWSTQQINRAPLFVEIRNHDQRRRSTQRLQKLFDHASEIHTSLDLPSRPTPSKKQSA